MSPRTRVKSKTHVGLNEAASDLGIGYETLRVMVVDENEFTIRRRVDKQGSPISIPRDEVKVFARDLDIEALRAFRKKMKRK